MAKINKITYVTCNICNEKIRLNNINKHEKICLNIKSNISGIYAIKNIVNNKIYVGKSKDLRNRILQHRHELLNNEHINLLLQSDFDKYGIKNFKFKILEINNIDLLHNEKVWIKKYDSDNIENGYNIVGINKRMINEYISK